MPNFHFFADSIGSASFDMSTDGSARTFVDTDVTIANDSGITVIGDAGYQNVNVHGTVWSTSNAVSLQGNYSSVLVGQTGKLTNSNYGDYAALVLSGYHSLVTNSGEISGTIGAWIGGAQSQIINHGTMTGHGQGYYYYNAALVFYIDSEVTSAPTENHKASVTNFGSMSGVSYSYYGELSAVAIEDRSSTYTIDGAGTTAWATDVSVFNHGDIHGRILLKQGNDLVVNSGIIVGDVEMGNDNDTYRGRRDGFVDGDIEGEAGNDKLIGASQADTMLGGAGNDTLRGAGGDDDLRGDNGNDKIWGGSDDDYLNGGSGKDTLLGNLGDDTLLGGGGNDTLNGGRGDDTLTGGGGADRFVFKRDAGNDVITDFVDGSDKINLSAYGLSGFSDISTALALQSAGGDVVLDLDALGGSGSVIIENTLIGNFSGSDFIF